ncbi:MAG: LysM peptidoglycan-binding domain-containing protein [Desulfarculaceae bacterium]|jgi:LysM repeat protein
MNRGDYNDMGPRIEIGPEPQESSYTSRTTQTGPVPDMVSLQRKKGGSGLVAWTGLLLALIALAVGLWGVLTQPEPVPGPPPSPGVVPGGAAERVASLEKDVQGLMLRMVTLEKEIQALGKKAGSVTKLAELSNQLAGLQDRLDALTLEMKTSALARRTQSGASKPPQREEKPQTQAKSPAPSKPKPVAKPAPKKARKLIYKVRPGDSLFSIALRYKVTVKDLMKWNKLKKGDLLKANEELVIYK